jgi:hypothetical protein
VQTVALELSHRLGAQVHGLEQAFLGKPCYMAVEDWLPAANDSHHVTFRRPGDMAQLILRLKPHTESSEFSRSLAPSLSRRLIAIEFSPSTFGI